MKISKGPKMGGEDGRTLHLQGPDITGGRIKKSMYQENVFHIHNIPITHLPIPYMAKLILIQIRTKNFPKTAVFSHYDSEESGTRLHDIKSRNSYLHHHCCETPKSQKRNSMFFWAPTRFISFEEISNGSCPEKVESDPSLPTLLLQDAF